MRTFASDEQFRVVSSDGPVYGPYPLLGTARAVRTQKENDFRNDPYVFIIERAAVKWKYVE